MEPTNETAAPRPTMPARGIVAVLSIVCLIVAAGLMLARLAAQVEATAEMNAARQAAPQNAASEAEQTESDGPLTIRSRRHSVEQNLKFYDGDVQISLPPLAIQCQHVQRESAGQPIRLAGNGGVVIRGLPGFQKLTADNFVFDARHDGRMLLAGEVQTDGRDGRAKYRFCELALDGSLIRARSLLDDFAASQTTARKLALLDDITVLYSDDELPPEATWLLAMKLLERRLTWSVAARPADEPLGKAGEAASADEWPEVHAGEPWMRELRPAAVCWRLNERRHVDVVRAVALLKRTGADAADNQRRRQWLEAIQQNNTLLRMIVSETCPPHAAATVTLDARNVERLTVRLYRVGNGAAWAAVRQREGRDFIYAKNAIRFASPDAAPPAGPKKLTELMDNQVAEWTVVPVKLPRNDDMAAKRSAPGGAWCGNRKLTIAADALAQPGYYVLAVAANGETAFAPIRVEEAK